MEYRFARRRFVVKRRNGVKSGFTVVAILFIGLEKLFDIG